MLIVLRRIAAVLLVPVFLLVMIGGLAVFRVNDTLLEPEFYSDTLTKVDFYEFLYDSALPAALDESDVDLEADFVGLGLTNARVVDYARRVFPPAFVEDTVNEVTGQLIPYLTGETDAFVINIPLSERVTAALDVVRDAIDGGDVYGFVLDDLVEAEVVKGGDTYLNDLPYGLALTPAKIVEGVREVAPRDWFEEQLAAVLDEISPYVTGDSDTFSLDFQFQDRVDIALVIVERWLLESIDDGAYEYLLEEQIVPVVQANIGAAAVLPFGVEITDAELIDAIANVLPSAWVAARVSEGIDALGPYITGRTDQLRLVLPLADRWQLATEALVDLTDVKFRTLYEGLRECSLAEALTVVDGLSLDQLPPCRPPLISYDLLKTTVGLDVLTELTTSLIDQLPASVVLTQNDLLAEVLATGVDLDEVRGYLRDGYSYTDVDLRGDVAELAGANSAEVLARYDDVLRWLREGIEFTEQDINDELSADELDTFDRVRGWIGSGRDLLFLLLVIPALLVVGIGFLGGRSWWSRLTWAGVAPLLAGAVLAIGIGLSTGPVGDAIKDPIRDIDANAVFIERAVDAGDELASAFLGPIQTQSIILAVIGLAMVTIGVAGTVRRGGPPSPALAGGLAAAGPVLAEPVDAPPEPETLAPPEAETEPDAEPPVPDAAPEAPTEPDDDDADEERPPTA